MKLSERRALITGGNRGFGAHIARFYVREGADVCICARDARRLEQVADELRGLCVSPAQRIRAVPCDVTGERAVEQVFERIRAEWEGLDLLVNCAGVPGPPAPCGEFPWADWKKAIEINIYGTVYPSILALALMKRQGWGKIVNISGGGATKPLPNLSAYAASKAAVVRFTETLALELKPFRIDVNAVAPGVLNTELIDEFVKAGVESLGVAYFEEVRRQKENGAPAMDRAAALCVYLGSAASDGITGKLISAAWDPWPNLREHLDDLQQTEVYTLRRITPADRGLKWGDVR